MTPARYVVPGEVVVALAGCLSQAFDGVAIAALAGQEGNADALAVALRYTHVRLDCIYESLLAVVTEQPPEETHGPERAC
jgi:hypothetical protein